MIGLDGVEMPKDCHECGAFGISDVVGLNCPCEINPELYDYEKRPDGCPLCELGCDNNE
jgi:hypothetical protein